MTDDQLNALQKASKTHSASHGHPATRAILEKIAGVTGITNVPESKVDAVIAALRLGGNAIDPAAIYSAYNKRKDRVRG